MATLNDQFAPDDLYPYEDEPGQDWEPEPMYPYDLPTKGLETDPKPDAPPAPHIQAWNDRSWINANQPKWERIPERRTKR